jgi:hypothetical protein
MHKLCLALFLATVAGCGGTDDPDPVVDAAVVIPDAMVGAAPVISLVEWTMADDCPTTKTVEVTITATDAEDAVGDLVFGGTLSSCTPSPFTGSPATLTCPQASTYGGVARATDTDGNVTSLSFSVAMCTDGTKTP